MSVHQLELYGMNDGSNENGMEDQVLVGILSH